MKLKFLKRIFNFLPFSTHNDACKQGTALFLLAVIFLPLGLKAQQFLEQRKPIRLVDWQFVQADVSVSSPSLRERIDWEVVKVPHTWNAKDVLTKGVRSYHGVATYRCNLDNLSKIPNKRHFLRFEGASLQAWVYINNKLVGHHSGAFGAFCFEITDFLKKGAKEENQILVQVNNVPNRNIAPPSENLYPIFGGIYRPVTYFTTDASCISPLDYASSGVYVSQSNITQDEANLDISTLLYCKPMDKTKYNLQIVFLDTEGNEVARTQKGIELDKASDTLLKQHMKIRKPHLWRGKKAPYQYLCKVTLFKDGKEVLDEVDQSIGLRSFEVKKGKGFYLNGEHYPIYGVCRHQEIEGYGPALSDEQQKYDFELIKELGANAVRLAHYQQADVFYDEFSKNGLMVWAEIPNTPPYQENNPRFLGSCKQQLTELIKQNFNKTAIFCWGMYNETRITTNDITILHHLAKQLDPLRYTVFADNIPPGKVHTVTDLAAWNMYYGWYGKAGDWKGYENKVLGIMDTYPDLKVGISEYGAGGCIDQQTEDEVPQRPNPSSGTFFPEQYQAYYHENVWSHIKDLDFIWCKFVWNMFDFSWTTVKRGDRAFINHKGLITHDRKTKKDAYYFYKANWSVEPVVYIANRRVVNRKKQHTFVKVYSNLDKVALRINGRTVSSKKVTSEIHVVKWDNIVLQEGINTVDVIGEKGKLKYVDHCEWNYDAGKQ